MRGFYSRDPSRRLAPTFSSPTHCLTLKPSFSIIVIFGAPVQTVKGELDDPVGVLASLVSSTVSLGLPRASGHLYVIGQLLTDASRDRVLATTLGNACFGRRSDDHAHRQALGIGGGGTEVGVSISPDGAGDGVTERSVEGGRLRGFGPFLAAHALSPSCPDHVRSDVLYVAMELLDCSTTACIDAAVALPQVDIEVYCVVGVYHIAE